MARPRSQPLVIDASVARAAGPEGTIHPTAKHCRDFLLAVLDICHRAVFSVVLGDEWKAHQSSFARQWRVSMFARKKVERVDHPENHHLRRQLERAAPAAKQRDAMLKDVHLIEAALVGALRIAALDETVRGYFRSASIRVHLLGQICWINPAAAHEDAVGWLQAGAPRDASRLLGSPRKRR